MKLKNIVIFLLVACAATPAEERWFADAQESAQTGGEWRVRTSLYTVHYHPKPEHNNHQRLVGVEYRRPDDWLFGTAYFRNSFDQPSVYLYVGHEWQLWQHEHWRLRGALTGGLLYGYRDEYKDKIPFNQYGVAPALLPSLTLDYHQVFLEMQFFAASGLLTAVGFRFAAD